MLNGWEIVMILAIVLILFGARKLPELARGLGQGIKEFKKASREMQSEIESAIDMDSPPPPPRKLPDETQARTSEPAPQSSESRT
jgi:sec-independent protein translocase protein TatA